MAIEMFVKCSVCGKLQKADRPNKYHVFPEGWFLSYSKPTEPEQYLVCSGLCVQKSHEERVEISLAPLHWKQISREVRKPVDPKDCGWCKALKHLCPGHAKQAAKRAAGVE